MAMSYNSISHHHLADHLIYLSSSSSFWVSLNSSYDHEFHLSKRLGMSPQDCKDLLMALDLASIHKRWGFSIKVMKWKVFLEHWFCTSNGTVPFEVATNRMDYNALPAGCCIISCCPLLLELTSSEPLILDEEVRMQEEWHRDERKCTLVILARNLLRLQVRYWSRVGNIFFPLILVRIHTNEFIQLVYKLYSTNLYKVWFLYQFNNFYTNCIVLIHTRCDFLFCF
jgi:hypothetical protein